MQGKTVSSLTIFFRTICRLFPINLYTRNVTQNCPKLTEIFDPAFFIKKICFRLVGHMCSVLTQLRFFESFKRAKPKTLQFKIKKKKKSKPFSALLLQSRSRRTALEQEPNPLL